VDECCAAFEQEVTALVRHREFCEIFLQLLVRLVVSLYGASELFSNERTAPVLRIRMECLDGLCANAGFTYKNSWSRFNMKKTELGK